MTASDRTFLKRYLTSVVHSVTFHWRSSFPPNMNHEYICSRSSSGWIYSPSERQPQFDFWWSDVFLHRLHRRPLSVPLIWFKHHHALGGAHFSKLVSWIKNEAAIFPRSWRRLRASDGSTWDRNVTSRSSADFDATRLMDLWEFQAKKKTHEAASSYPKCRL